MRALAALLTLYVASAAWAGDVDADGIDDAADNCPHFANPSQADTGGIGAASGPDGIGDACQCGDVSGNGRVTTADASMMQAALLVPPTATMTRPDLCNVGGSKGCTTADATIITRALLVPPTATISQSCSPGASVTDRWLIEGDTQNWVAHAGAGVFVLSTGTWVYYYTPPSQWDATHTWLCANKSALSLRGIIGTGDIVPTPDAPPNGPEYWVSADYAYDITDACGIPAALPAGNHDWSASAGWSDYTAFLASRPLHAPVAQSASGMAWVELLADEFWLMVLPFGASTSDENWASNYIANAPAGTRFFVFQHDAVDPGYPGTIPTTRAAGRIAQTHGYAKVPVVIGGHFTPADHVQSWTNSLGQRALLTNYQRKAPPNAGYNWGAMTWLTYSSASGRWCFNDFNQITGVEHAFEPPTCWVP